MAPVTHDGGKRGGKIRVVLGWVAVVVVVAAVVATVGYRTRYHVWPGQTAGSRISYCGRDYDAGNSGLSLRGIQAESSAPVRNTGEYPPLGPQHALYAAASSGYCPTVVFLETGPGQFTAYALQGGP